MSVSNTLLGLVAGLALGLGAVFGGIGGFFVVLILGAIGLGVGRYLDGKLDLDGIAGRNRTNGPRR